MSIIKIRQDNEFVDIPTLTGPQGPQGSAGQGIPMGGNENNVLVKNSPANYDTSWKSLVDLIYPIGCYFETSDVAFNPIVSFGGVWEQEEDGTVLASRQTQIGGSLLGASVGQVVGEENHTLTIEEMPSHYHEQSLVGKENGTSGNAAYEWVVSNDNGYLYSGTDLALPTGGGYAHNNVQPTKIVCRWHRIG